MFMVMGVLPVTDVMLFQVPDGVGTGLASGWCGM